MAVGDMLFINFITSVEVCWLRSVMIYFKILIYTAQLKEFSIQQFEIICSDLCSVFMVDLMVHICGEWHKNWFLNEFNCLSFFYPCTLK